jgi:hypothetical protein
VLTNAVPRPHLRTVAALQRVNRHLSAWDDLDAMASLPPILRQVSISTLDREQLKSLQAELIADLAELEPRHPGRLLPREG